MRPFAPVSLRPGQAALLASVASHGRKPLSPQTAFTGSLLPAPTNPGDSLASPSFGWSHNSSFKPTPHRGVNSVLYATLHAVAAPLQVGLTQALCAVLQEVVRVHCRCDFISHHTPPQPSKARIFQFNVRAAHLPARQRSGWLLAPDGTRLMKPFAPESLRPGSAAPWASVAGLGRQTSSLHPVLTGSRLSAPINPRDILASPG